MRKKRIKLVSRTNELKGLLGKRAGGDFYISAFKRGMGIILRFCEKSVQSDGKIKTYRKLWCTAKYSTGIGLFQCLGHMLKAKGDKY